MTTKYTLALLLAFILNFAYGQSSKSQVWVADQGDGTYKNPILYADYSDPDVIRVGDDYYMTASSFNCVPALPILHSKDLVNWELVNYALPQLYMPGVEPSNFFDKAQHGKGVWAPSLRYANGEYMIYWGDPDFGIYMVKSREPMGRWEKPILVLPGKGRIDPCPLFDDDGKVYLVHAWAGSRSNFNSVMTICEMNAQGTAVVGGESLIFDGNDGVNHTVEGGKFYKKNGYYYLLAPAGGVATGWQIALRSKNIYGPYELKRVMAQGKTTINGPHQGGLVETQNGESWFIHFQDLGAYGRVSHLQPVTWRDAWPVIGTNDKDYCGEPVLTHKKPNVGHTYPIQTPQQSDEFNSHSLGLQWSWHANPKQGWGFPSTNGYLRMYGQYYPDEYKNLWNIPNLLMQKLPAPEFTATVKLSATLQNDGDKVGLAMMGWDYSYLALAKSGNGYRLEQAVCTDAELLGEQQIVANTAPKQIKTNQYYNFKTPLEGAEIYLRVEVTHGAVCTFSYSTDGQKFQSVGIVFNAKQGKWIGTKMGLFVLNKKPMSPRSWIDADWFRITK